MTNKLAHENSPYLLQHADNPVDWYPWGEDALARARREKKPVFLSIGYAACHWCHVMAHESFEDPQIAAIMNENFINIKVDREERPDLDNIYMNAVVALTGQGGWPMSLFLTPDGKPFYGGTYFPPVARYNLPSFRDVLTGISQAWKDNQEELLKSSESIARQMQASDPIGASTQAITKEVLDKAAFTLAQTYDWKHGGWGQAPKFPQPMAIEFLLNRASRGDRMALDVAVHALKAMAKGGMYDVVGGGFARYSTDNDWLVPHFEKMLYDNAQLSRVYLHAYLITDDIEFQRVCIETLDFILRELSHPQGGFYSSLDADSEGEEGKYYVWTLDEARSIFTDTQDFDFFLAAFPITAGGNFDEANILQRALDDTQLAQKFGLTVEQAAERVKILTGRLYEARQKRVPPGTDDKVLTSWNSLMLVSFAEAGRYLKRSNYIDAAARNADFLMKSLHPGDRLMRSWRNGKARHNAYLEDYASLISGLLALYQSNPDARWFIFAEELAVEMIQHYQDPQGGFFDTRDDHEELLLRPKDLQDNATPSGNSMAAGALLQLSAYNGRNDWRDLGESLLGSVAAAAARYPTAFAQWLAVMDFALGPVQEIAILGDEKDQAARALVDVLWSAYRPRAVAAISTYPPDPGSPLLLEDRPLLHGLPTAYVCQNFACLMPVNDPAGLLQQLAQFTSSVTGQ